MIEEYVPYYRYENDLEEKEHEITYLQDELYKKDKEIEKLENLIEELKNEKNIQMVFNNARRIRKF